MPANAASNTRTEAATAIAAIAKKRGINFPHRKSASPNGERRQTNSLHE
jgi:hypothetical protein